VSFAVEAVTLEHDTVRLEPLSLDHLDGLCEVGLDAKIWEWNPEPIEDRADMRAYIETALAWQKRGHCLPFATVLAHENRPIGSTRFAWIDPANRRAEIGWTWIAPKWQRTAVNTEAKFLMLTHAFETWGLIRVELKTDALNERSRAAMRRIGAVEEGILRQHWITASGRYRDSVYYSILDSEWPRVKRWFRKKLGISS
jgi:RimJ/RimL family protein N-acetyltransferase